MTVSYEAAFYVLHFLAILVGIRKSEWIGTIMGGGVGGVWISVLFWVVFGWSQTVSLRQLSGFFAVCLILAYCGYALTVPFYEFLSALTVVSLTLIAGPA